MQGDDPAVGPDAPELDDASALGAEAGDRGGGDAPEPRRTRGGGSHVDEASALAAFQESRGPTGADGEPLQERRPLRADAEEVAAYAAAFDKARGDRSQGLHQHEQVDAVSRILSGWTTSGSGGPIHDEDGSVATLGDPHGSDGGEGEGGGGGADGERESEPTTRVIEPHGGHTPSPVALRRHRTSPREWAGLAVETVVAMAVVAGSGPAPTGWGVIDVVERMALAGFVVLAGSRARRWALIVGAGCMGAAGAGLALVAGALALGLATFLTLADRRVRMLGGAVGGLVVIAAYRLPPGDDPTGFRWLLALAAIGVILLAGYRNLRLGDRQRWRRIALGVVGGAVFLVVAGVVVGLRARGDVTQAIDQTGRAVDAVEAGDTKGAQQHFVRANSAFARAHDRLAAPVFRLLRVVPVVSQNLRAIDGATEVGEGLTETLAYEVGSVRYEQLSLPKGGIDLDVLASFRQPVATTQRQLTRGSGAVDRLVSPWLVGPVRKRLDELAARLAQHRREIGFAALAIRRAPAVLGADRPRRYLVLLGNPAEARDLGGHIGNWAELTFTDGRMRLVRVGSPNDLVLPSRREDAPLVADFGPALQEMDPLRFPQNWSADPDLPTDARLARVLFEKKTGRRLDGVAYADAQTFAALVAITGPRRVPGTIRPVRLTGENAARFLTSGQYVSFPSERASNDIVEDLVRDVFEDFTHTKLPGPRSLGDRFSPLVRDGRLAFTTFHDADRPLLERLRIESRVPPLQGTNLLGIVSRNANPSKIDVYLHRRTEATFRWDPTTGDVRGTVEVRLTNDAPSKGFNKVVLGNQYGEPRGTNVTDLALMTRFDLSSVTIDGRRAEVQSYDAGGYWRHRVRVSLRAGASAVVRYRISGTVTPGGDQQIVVIGQPLVNRGLLRIRIDPTVGHVRSPDALTDDQSGEGVIDADDIADRRFVVTLD